MKMKFLLVLGLIFLALPMKVKAIYDPLSTANNKYGIHIFDANELDRAASVVNTSGGEWGYVTVVIQSDDRDREKWNEFMHKCSEKKLIPIVRLATFVSGENWTKPTRWDSVDFANFLNDLDWPTKNRYVVIYNEPNHGNEWGGSTDPASYAKVLKETSEVFHDRNEDFYILAAGLDMAAPNSGSKHNKWKNFIYGMYRAQPDIFDYVDGWNSHAYPNHEFSSSPYDKHDHSIISYRYELDYVKSLSGRDFDVFITETGWSSEWLSDNRVSSYWQIALNDIWTDENIVAITPFVLFAGAGPFEKFSFFYHNLEEKPACKVYKAHAKTKGEPWFAPEKVETELPVLGEQTVDNSYKQKFDLKKINKLLDFMRFEN